MPQSNPIASTSTTSTSTPTVPLSGKILYSLGNVGSSIVDRVVCTFVMFYYAPTQGLAGHHVQLAPAAVVGSIFLIGRVLDTFFDPAVAFYSDKCTSRRGRRMPFMLYGGLPLALLLAAMFFPPVQDGISIYNSIYLCVTLSAFFFFFSFYVCPYLGLLPEITRTPQDRINLTSMQGVFMLFGTAIGMAGAPILISKFGYKSMAIIMATIAFIAFYAPVIGINEKRYCSAEPSSLNMKEMILQTLRNKPFIIYLCGNLTFWFGFNIISTCVPYYVTALLKQNEGMVAVFMALALGVALLNIPLMSKLALKIGKRNAMIFCLFMFMLLLPLIYFFGDPRIPIPPMILGYIILSLLGIPLAGLFILPNAMVADLTDYDEKLTGFRREAIYFGTQGLFLKIDLGVSQFLMAMMLSRFGMSVAHPLGIRLTGLVGGFFALVGIIAFLFYPKDLDAHAENELWKRQSH